jgi:CheY-like chemotaxis protein
VSKISFLVVDDSPTTRELVSRSLKLVFGSAEIFMAENGKEALRVLKEKDIDIIISDWNMPQMDGEELLFEVRNNPKLKELPFVLMTSNANRDFIITAIQLGVTQYIVKPFSPGELERKVRSSLNVLRRRQEQRYSLPEHTAVVRIGKECYMGKMLDLSRTGTLLVVDYDENMRLYRNCDVDLQLHDPNGIESKASLISSLVGTIVRLEAENTFHPTSRGCQMALYFHPATMEKDVERKLTNLIKWLANKTPGVIGDK